MHSYGFAFPSLTQSLPSNKPEEGVVFDARLPKALGGLVISQLEPDRGFVRIELSRSDFDVEVVSLIRDLQNLGPGEPIDSQSELRINQSI